MNWYYAVGGEQKGPVTQPEFDTLVQQGVIKPDTLVWHENLSEWQPLAALPSRSSQPPAAAQPPPVITPGAGQNLCADCNRVFAQDDLVMLDGRLICANCKPLAVQRLREGVTRSDNTAEEVRKQHLAHEASIKAVSSLYLLAGSLVLLVSVFLLFGNFASPGGPRVHAFQGIVMVALAVIQIWTSFGLRKFRRYARIIALVLSCIGLLNIPIGTLINGYILYLLLNKKSKVVFSPEYQQIIAATPHLKYRTPVWLWILLILLILVIVLGIGFAVAA